MVRECKTDIDRIEIRVPCKPEYVRTARKAVAEFAELVHMPKVDVEEVEVAASEAVANIIRHAYRDCERALPVRVTCARRRNDLVLRVVDKGCGFIAPAENVVPEVSIDREGGFGIIIIKELMDSVNYVSTPGRGTTIRMVKHLRSGKTPARVTEAAKLRDVIPIAPPVSRSRQTTARRATSGAASGGS